MSDAIPTKLRMTQDNVLIVFKPLPKMANGLHLPDRKVSNREAREATVVAVGPGAWRRINKRAAEGMPTTDELYKFVPTEVKAGDTVFVDAVAGQDYRLDLDVPRHNKGAQFEELCGEGGEFRIVREDEIHFVVEP